MKRILMAMGMMLASCAAMADTWTDPKTKITWTYTVSDGKASVGDVSSCSTAVPTSTTGAITIPSNLGGCPVTSIGKLAFFGCSELRSVAIPSGVTSIGIGAFWDNTSLGSVTIPSSVTSIGNNAFACSGLMSVTIPSSVTSIGEYAFRGCSGLTSVTIPSSVTSIGSGAFYECTRIENVTIASSVKNIGDEVFSGCSGLTSVTIPEGVTSIGSWAFSGCSGLTSVAIPSSVASIGSDAFYGCGGMMSFDVDAGNPNYKSVNGLLLSKDGKTLIFGVNGNVTIPEGVTSIGGYAFYDCRGLTNVTIPSSVTSIGKGAFYYCSGMTNVVFGGNAPTCGATVFDNVKSGCTATVKWGTTGWDDDGDGKWQGLTLVWQNAPKSDGGPYTESVGETEWTFMVSGGKASVTQANPAKGAVTIPSTLGGRSVTSIGDVAFLQCTDLTSVTIPASVTTIGNSAFWGCSHLADVYFEGDTISSIGHEAFTDCYWDLIMHVPATWKGRGRTICGYTVLKGSMFIVK